MIAPPPKGVVLQTHTLLLGGRVVEAWCLPLLPEVQLERGVVETGHLPLPPKLRGYSLLPPSQEG